MWNVHGVNPDRSFTLPFLGCDVTKEVAATYAQRYAAKYIGKQMPNGAGTFPWTAFVSIPVADAADIC